MSNISTIFSGIKTVIQAKLGSTYSELSHVVDLSKNSFYSLSTRYGVMPQGSKEQSGVTVANTLDQGFKIILTDEYVSDTIEDASIIAKQVALIGLFEDIFRELVRTKCGAPSVVMFVGDFAIEECYLIEKQKIIIVEAHVNVRSRVMI